MARPATSIAGPHLPLIAGRENVSDSVNSNIYRIRDWAELYEVAQSRRPSTLYWVPMRNRMGEDGYIELVAGHPNGTAHSAVWDALVFIASTCKPRGTLLRANGQAHTPETINRVSRIPESIVIEALPRLLDIGWLEALPHVKQQASQSESSPPANPPTHTNGKELKPDTVLSFESWWVEWTRGTNYNEDRAGAKTAWTKVFKPDTIPAAMACTTNYILSDKVARGIVMNPSKWIAKQAADNWQARWAPAKVKSGRTEQITRNLEHMYGED